MSIGSILGGIASSAIGAIGGFLGQKSANEANREIAEANSAFNAAEAQRNRDFQSYWAQQEMGYNAGQAEIQRGWQERLANTSYQRAVSDMRSAGLNPMLAYSQGGAATPSGSSASMSSPHGGQASAVQPAPMLNKFAAAAQAAQTVAGVQLAEAQAKRTDAEAENIGVETERARLTLPPSREYVVDRMYTEYAKLRHELGIAKWDEYIVQKWLRNTGAEADRIKAETDSLKARTVITRLEKVEKQAEADYFRDVGKGGIYWREGRAAAGTLLGVTAAGKAAKMARELGTGLRYNPALRYRAYGR